jgi:hypothetical protein
MKMKLKSLSKWAVVVVDKAVGEFDTALMTAVLNGRAWPDAIFSEKVDAQHWLAEMRSMYIKDGASAKAFDEKYLILKVHVSVDTEGIG